MQLFDVRLGTGSDPAYDGPNADQAGTSWNRGALRLYYSSSYNDYTWPTVTPQSNNGNLYWQDIFVPVTLDGSGNVATWMLGVDYYGYDWLNRLTKVDELPAASWVGGGSIGWLPQAYAQHYKYDRFGNRLLDTVATWGIGINRKAFALDITTDANNQPLATTHRLKVPAGQSGAMEYDVAGNLTRDTWTGGNAARFNYDAENRIKTATNDSGTTVYGSYTYDADGRRVRRVTLEDGVQKEYWQVYGVGGELVAEYQVVSGTPTLKKEYGYRNGQLLVIAEATGACQWLVTDGLGTPRMLVDQTGNLSGMKRRDYLPFGEELLAGMGHRQTSDGYGTLQAQPPRQGFTSKERDAETGLDYFEARYYSSVMGRFTSPDEFTGGPDELYDFAEVASDNPTFYADLTEPQSLNKYVYCYNNPLNMIDPDGHGPRDLLKAAVQTVVETANGIASAVVENNGLPASQLPQNSLGRAIGHGLSLAQGIGEVVLGAVIAGGGGVGGAATSPTGAGAVLGAAVAVGGAAMATHGGAVTLNTVHNIFSKKTTTQGTTTSDKKPVVMGENVKGRIKPFAEQNGYDYYKPRNWNMPNNRRWIKTKKKEGREIIDIGIDPRRKRRSKAYKMESEETKDYPNKRVVKPEDEG
jgi:RHS repeat-associated protein